VIQKIHVVMGVCRGKAWPICAYKQKHDAENHAQGCRETLAKIHEDQQEVDYSVWEIELVEYL
jgi:hypothetical protein